MRTILFTAGVTSLLAILIMSSASAVETSTFGRYAAYTIPSKNSDGDVLASACAYDSNASELLATAALNEYMASKSFSIKEDLANEYTAKTTSLVVTKVRKAKVVQQESVTLSSGLTSICTLVTLVN